MTLSNCQLAESLKEVGSIVPVGCSLISAHIVSDYIYALCGFDDAFGTAGNIRQYEKQKPFDLLSLILTFDIEDHDIEIGSQYSEVSNCFYICDSGSIVWRIGIDDHTVTTFLSINSTIKCLAIASNGHLYILVERKMATSPLVAMFSLLVYASDATFIGDIELPGFVGSPSIIHVGGNNSLWPTPIIITV